MSSIAERIQTPLDENLEIGGRTRGHALRLDVSITDGDVTSSDVVAFWKLVCEEFGIDIPADEFSELLTPNDPISYLEART